MLNRIARVIATMSAAFAVLTVVSAMLVVGSTTMASARSSAEAITAYDIDITVNPDGSALFRESISYDFGPNARHGIERILATTMRYDEANDRSYPLTVVKVSAVGASAQYSITDIGGGRERITCPATPHASLVSRAAPVPPPATSPASARFPPPARPRRPRSLSSHSTPARTLRSSWPSPMSTAAPSNHSPSLSPRTSRSPALSATCSRSHH